MKVKTKTKKRKIKTRKMKKRKTKKGCNKEVATTYIATDHDNPYTSQADSDPDPDRLISDSRRFRAGARVLMTLRSSSVVIRSRLLHDPKHINAWIERGESQLHVNERRCRPLEKTCSTEVLVAVDGTRQMST